MRKNYVNQKVIDYTLIEELPTKGNSYFSLYKAFKQ